MTLGEIGAYITLLCYAWLEPDCALTNNQDDLKILARWDTATPKDRWERIMACFPKHPTRKKCVHNPRLYKEWLRAREISAERSHAAKKRWEHHATQPLKPSLISKDHTKKGLTTIAQDVVAIADKHFPPI